MKRELVLIILFIYLFSILFNFLPAVPITHEITTFNDKIAEKTVSFSAGGLPNRTTEIEIPKKAVVTNSSFDISTVFNLPNYPQDPQVDVGSDGDTEWAFSGIGYGQYGRQNVFSDDQSTFSKFFDGNVTYEDNLTLRIPKNASINSASMKVESFDKKNITIDPSGTNSWVLPFYGTNWNQIRLQSLYRNYDIDTTGYISKIYFKARTSQSNAQFNYFTVKFYNTTVSSLSSTFSSNNKTNNISSEPVIVFSENLTLTTTSGQWSEIDVNDTFYYNNKNNLLIEITWNTDNGRTINTEYNTYNYTHTVYTQSTTGTTGSTTTIGHDIILQFDSGAAINVTVDIGNNGTLEFNHTGEYVGSKNIKDFSSELINLTTDLPISFTDGYGNQFVDIPINFTNEAKGLVILSNVNIKYNLTSKVFLNPHNGNLTNELNELIPSTGEGNMTIPINLRTSSAGQLRIWNISIKYFVPEITNDRLILLNGHGLNGICYADYENYMFMANVTNKEGTGDVSDVYLILDADREKIQLRWNQSNNEFSEFYDPNNLVKIDEMNCSSTKLDSERWNLNFSVRFTWAYPDEALEQCALNTTNNSGSWVLDYFYNVYRVENDLELIGILNVEAKRQGVLKDNGINNWVQASEKVTWSNLTAVYQGTTNFYPDNKNFNITIEDNDGDKWVNTSSSGQKFSITTTSDSDSDYNNIHYINITDIPGVGQDASSWSFEIKIDNDGPLAPTVTCHADTKNDPETDADDDTTVYIQWDDANDQGGSGVKEYAMEFNNNKPTTIHSKGDSAIGVEGVAVFYVRARDKVGNWGTSGSGSIIIDLTALTFSEPVPSPDMWYYKLKAECGVSIQDLGGSGVLGNDIQYRYVESGSIETGAWNAYPSVPNAETIICRQNITFTEDGVEKKIQWRAKDVAGNGFILSDIYTLKIDKTNITFEKFNFNFDKWYNSPTHTIEFYVNDTNPFGGESSGVDTNSIFYSISTLGTSNYGDWIQISPDGSGTSVECSVTPTFNEGILNYIRFKGKDLAGNEYNSTDYNLKIDTTPPSFSNPVPESVVWANKTHIQCNITIFDEYSKVDAKSVRYAISKNGTNQFSSWRVINLKHLSNYDFKRITLTCNDTFTEGDNNYIRWFAADTAANSFISNNYKILIDTTPCSFHKPLPLPTVWFNTIIINCSTIINDTNGAGVDIETIQYSTSVGGPSNMKKWSMKGIKVTELTGQPNGDRSTRTEESENLKFQSIEVKVTIDHFENGNENYIYWRVKDLAGNGYIISDPNKIQIDLSPISFSNEKPVHESTHLDQELICQITVIDEGGSDVDLESLEYRYTTSGESGYSDWIHKGISSSKKGRGYVILVYVTFDYGYDNFIQWRASDIAGNGPYESNEINLFVNSPPIIILNDPKKTGDYEENKNIIFDARKSSDPDFGDSLSFYWEVIDTESNTTSVLGHSEYFKSILFPGEYKIVLYLADEFGHNVSKDVEIIVKWFDLDGDDIPDIDDLDDDNDKVPDLDDVFPRNKDEWLDTDFDKIGNNADSDDDNDNVPDSEDKYPLDKNRWKDEPEDFLKSMGFTIVIIVIIIVIILLIMFIFFRKRAKKIKEEKEKTEKTEEGKVELVKKVPEGAISTQQLMQGLPPAPGPSPHYQQYQPTAPMPIPTFPPGPSQQPHTPFIPPQSVYMPGQLPMVPPPLQPGPTGPIPGPIPGPMPVPAPAPVPTPAPGPAVTLPGQQQDQQKQPEGTERPNQPVSPQSTSSNQANETQNIQSKKNPNIDTTK